MLIASHITVIAKCLQNKGILFYVKEWQSIFHADHACSPSSLITGNDWRISGWIPFAKLWTGTLTPCLPAAAPLCLCWLCHPFLLFVLFIFIIRIKGNSNRAGPNVEDNRTRRWGSVPGLNYGYNYVQLFYSGKTFSFHAHLLLI